MPPIAAQERRLHHGRFAVIGWLLPMATGHEWYLLYALLKGELLPPGLLGDDRPHVSLLGTLLWQTRRDGGGMAGASTTSSGTLCARTGCCATRSLCWPAWRRW